MSVIEGAGNAGAGAPQSGNSLAGSTGVTGGATQGQTTPLPTQTSSPTGGGAQSSPSEWTSGLNDDLRGYVQNKGFKDPGAVVESYRNLEKLHGVPRERLLKLPEKSDDPAWGEVYNRLGRPEKAQDYQLPVPDGDKGEFSLKASEWMHELGLSKQQGQALAQKWNNHFSEQSKAQQAQAQVQLKADQEALQKEWGAAYDQNMGMAKMALEKFNIPTDTINKIEGMLGFSDVVRLMRDIGSKLGEDRYISSDAQAPGFGKMSPAAALNKMDSLRKDQDFLRRISSRDSKALEEWDRLGHLAYDT